MDGFKAFPFVPTVQEVCWLFFVFLHLGYPSIITPDGKVHYPCVELRVFHGWKLCLQYIYFLIVYTNDFCSCLFSQLVM